MPYDFIQTFNDAMVRLKTNQTPSFNLTITLSFYRFQKMLPNFRIPQN